MPTHPPTPPSRPPREPGHDGAPPAAEDSSGRGEPVGQLIRRARCRRGLTQADLADALAAASGNTAVTRGHVARWERGRHIPSRYWLRWLTTVLRLPVREVEDAVLVAKLHRVAHQGATKLGP